MKKIDFEKSFKGTKGKWDLSKILARATICVDPKNPIKTENVCSIFGNVENEEPLANAKIIANAKDLAKALCESNEKLSQYASGIVMSPLKGDLQKLIETNYKLLKQSL